MGTTKLVLGLTGAVTLMGMSVSLKAVSGSSGGGMIDPRETHNNPRITIVQRTRFTRHPNLPHKLRAAQLFVNVKQATSRVYAEGRGFAVAAPALSHRPDDAKQWNAEVALNTLPKNE